MSSIKTPTLIMNGNNDIGSAEHAVKMYRIIPSIQLATLPGKHGDYIGAIDMAAGEKWEQ